MQDVAGLNRFALDVGSVGSSVAKDGGGREAQLRQAATEFESLFMHEMLKSMRSATPRSDLLRSNQSDFYESLMDQQWSRHLSARGVGLADYLLAQLQASERGSQAVVPHTERIAGIPRGTPTQLPPPSAIALDATRATRSSEAPERVVAGGSVQAGAEQTPSLFIDRLRPAADRVAAKTGVAAELMLAQAALETGWGRYRITTETGEDSFNLFGIKAGSDWQGASTAVATREFYNGDEQAVTERFRVYESEAAAFADYAQLMSANPRYQAVLDAGSADDAARALQAAGYATDPAYADKLIAVMEHNIRPRG